MRVCWSPLTIAQKCLKLLDILSQSLKRHVPAFGTPPVLFGCLNRGGWRSPTCGVEPLRMV
eukprot:15459708-Alexandrium_andersonii.AAC.1